MRIVNGTTVIDGVGSPTSPCREGAGLTTPNTSVDNAYERIGGVKDSNLNEADFQRAEAG